jgi:DNA-dependent RNA polymerase auxiliary subunit epsilon
MQVWKVRLEEDGDVCPKDCSTLCLNVDASVESEVREGW